MRNSIKRNVALWMVFFFLFSITGCGGGGGGGDSTGKDNTNQTAALQEHLTSFNSAMDWVADDLASQMETLDELNTALAQDDGSSEKTLEIGLLVDQFELDSEILLIDVEALDLAEAGIQNITNPETSLDSALITTIIGVGLVIKGLYSFGKAMKGYSDDMTEARKERDKAADDVVNNVPGALKKFNDAKKEMTDIGTDATQEFATKVTTELVLGPISPTSTTGVILKDAAGNKVQKGLKIISATKECEDGYDSPDCKIGVDETDDADSAVVPDGDVTIVVGGKDMARQIIKEEIPPGSYTEITIDPIPVKEATPQEIAESDTAAAGDDTTPTDPGDTDPGDDDTPTDPGDDTPVTPTMTLSSAVSSEDADSITYSVAAAVAGVAGSTTVTITVENASTGSSTKTLNEDGTVFWTVTVLEDDATVTVRRSDTGDQQSLTLNGKSYDGTYVGTISVTDNPGGFCEGSGFSVVVSGSTISSTEGPLTGTLTGNVMSAKAGDWWILSGSINNNVMSGTWYDIEGDCSGTFSVTKQ